MVSVTSKPSSILLQLNSSSTFLRRSCRSNLRVPSLKFPGRDVRSKEKLSFRIKYQDSSKKDALSISNGDSELQYIPYLPFGTLSDSKEDRFLDTIEKSLPEFVKSFMEDEPLLEIVVPIRDTVKKLLRTLPPHHLEGEYTAVAKLSALYMYTGLIVGILFHHIPFKEDLEKILRVQNKIMRLACLYHLVENELLEYLKSLEPQNLKEEEGVTPDKKKWKVNPIRTEAKRYAKLLKAEIKAMNHEIGEKSADEPNELLEYLKSLKPQLEELSSIAFYEDYRMDQMKRFIEVFFKVIVKGSTAPELSELLWSMMVVGFYMQIAVFKHKYEY